MKKLERKDMKQLKGGLRPPINGVCYGLGENCKNTSLPKCCPNLSCLTQVGNTAGVCIELLEA
jgi:hypothetical protein